MIGGILMGVPGVLMTAMLSDIGEYVHWRFGVKAEGVIFSTRTFGTKLSAGLIAFVVSLTLTLVNYVPNATQTTEATNGILIIAVDLSHLCGVLRHSVRETEPPSADCRSSKLNKKTSCIIKLSCKCA